MHFSSVWISPGLGMYGPMLTATTVLVHPLPDYTPGLGAFTCNGKRMRLVSKPTE